jgi:hypothetical protein
VTLVEADRSRVLLEDPEVQALAPQSLRLVQQGSSYPAALLVWLHVEALQRLPVVRPRAPDGEEPEQVPVLFREPDVFVPGEQVVGNQADVLLGHGRYVSHPVAGADEEPCERVLLVDTSGSHLHAS